jgi:hypothetical protein
VLFFFGAHMRRTRLYPLNPGVTHHKNSAFTEIAGEQSVPELSLVLASETPEMRVESSVVVAEGAAPQAEGAAMDPT